MATARFRFFGELDGFLPRARRDREFAVPIARDATVKHMIEALGVPHTEAGRLLVNGVDADFGQLLREGDQVLVHPQSATAQAGIAFIADAHLGGLARLLRMAGFDTLYDNHYRDEEIAALASSTARVVLTRDRELLKRREVEQGAYLHAIRLDAQLRELSARLQLAPLARPFTRCLECNVLLRPVAKSDVAERLPESVRLREEAFTTCDACGRVFWQGSHHRRMLAMLERAIGLESTP